MTLVLQERDYRIMTLVARYYMLVRADIQSLFGVDQDRIFRRRCGDLFEEGLLNRFINKTPGCGPSPFVYRSRRRDRAALLLAAPARNNSDCGDLPFALARPVRLQPTDLGIVSVVTRNFQIGDANGTCFD